MKKTLKGFATKEGTEKYFRFHEVHPEKKRILNDLFVSGIGIGTYLGDADDRTDDFYEKALLSSLSHGVNFIDTAINYRHQRSERLIHKVLEQAVDLGITRDQVVIATKGGFLPADKEVDDYNAHIRSRYIEKGIIKPTDIVHDTHCITPKFLEAEIEHSLHNLGVECIDLYYLHNPEIQLMELTENEFDEKMYKAFELLEQKVKENKIKCYGLATWNGFRQKYGSKNLLDLSKFLLFAENIAGENHHFKAIQLPLNFVMLEALKVSNQECEEERRTVLHLANEKKMHVMISSPFMQTRAFKLPSRIFDSLPNEMTNALKILQFLTSLSVTSVMIGMKNPNHVHENTKLLQQPNWTKEDLEAACKVLGC